MCKNVRTKQEDVRVRKSDDEKDDELKEGCKLFMFKIHCNKWIIGNGIIRSSPKE